MKGTLWTMGVISLLLWLLAAGGTGVTRQASDQFYQAACQLEEKVMAGAWTQLERDFAALESSWQNSQQTLQLLIHHQDTDDVTLALRRVKAALLLKDAALAMDALASLKESCLHLYHRDALRLTNLI